MGFIRMLIVNRELNAKVEEIHGKFHRLEDLINGHRGVDASNFAEVNTLISSISRDVFEMSQKIALLLRWTDGCKYAWVEWNSYAWLSISQAKSFVNQYRPGYYK